MGFLRVNSCCCGCTLEKGTRIIAYMGLVGGFLGFLGLFFASANQAVPKEVLLMKVVGQVGAIVLSGLLLHGCNKRKPAFVLCWLVVQGIGLALACFIIPIYIGILIFAASQGASGEAIGIIVFALVIMGLAMTLAIYLYAVVYSFYHQLKEEAAGGQPGFIAVPANQGNIYKAQDPEYGVGYPPQQQQYPQQQPQYQPAYNYKA